MAAFAASIDLEATLFLAAFALSILGALLLGWFFLAIPLLAERNPGVHHLGTLS